MPFLRLLLAPSRRVMLLCAGLSSLGGASTARAQDMPPVWAYGESQVAHAEACGVSMANALAALQAGIRAAGATVPAERGPRTSVDAYYEIILLPRNPTCAAAVTLTFENNASVISPISGREHWAKITFCRQTALLRGRGAGLQSEIEANLRRFAAKCVEEYRAFQGDAPGEPGQETPPPEPVPPTR